MTHVGENITIMDRTPTTFGKEKLLSLTRSLAFFLLLLFVGCMIATGLLVYNLTTSDSCPNTTKVENLAIGPQLAVTTIPVDGREIETTTTTTTTSAAATSTNEAIIGKTKTEIDVRLPRSIRPHSYKIKLIPFIQEGNFTFHGDVTILINVTETSDNITLHADDLIIDNVVVFDSASTGQVLSIKEIANDTKRQFLIIYLDDPVESGKQYYVQIKFKGVLNDLLQGFYKSSYKEGNETRWIATTQFQATDARRAFPCFDEPALKATFQINLARLKNMTSISNMAKVNSRPVLNLPDFVWDIYEESVPMSTYLVAFVISDFGSMSNGNFSVWARRSAISQTKYSLLMGPKILQYYENFFGIKYPLPKLDMVALPDFSAGAMENWGLITYRESVLLYEESVSSRESLQRIVHVIAHELAHQWFGNLVTPVWWSDLWLNEGFATYVEFLGVDAVSPQLKEPDQFVIELHGAFMLDALKSSHQISVTVNNPGEISDIFDRISYSKGAAILRMMQHFLTLPVFRRGLNKYLTTRMYKNAEQDDLWATLTEQSHRDGVLDKSTTIKQIMDTWTVQTGFPVVSVTRNYNNRSVRFAQERFLLHRDGEDSKSVLWRIPITYADKTGSLNSVWLFEPSMEINHVKVTPNDWLLVNINQTGYYRVNYDQRNWDLLIAQIKTKKGHLVFDPKNRAQLINDAMNLASAGYLEYGVALNLTIYLIQEREFVPWKTAFTSFDYLYEMFVRTAYFHKYKAFFLGLIDSFYEELGFQEKIDDEQLLIYSRFEIYSRACKLGVRDCIIHAVQQFETWKNSPNPDRHNGISENMREIVYCTAISVGGEEEWDFAWERYQNANVDNEKEILLMALGCSKEIWILSRYLEWAVTENSGIRKHDAARVFAAVANNAIGRELAYRYLKTNWARLKSYLGESSMSLSSIVRSCTIKFNTQVEIDDFKYFIDRTKDEFLTTLRIAKQSIEQGEANVKWMEKNFKKIVHWLTFVNN